MPAITSELRDDGIRVVTMAHPPVNALPVQGWFDLAAALDEASADMATKVVILRADGKGFNAGVDIKEMQSTEGFDALLGANKGCFAAFKAVYECSVPVIAAVNGFCVGGGVGLVGNADIVVASDDAYFGVPEVKQGALGAATHMARLRFGRGREATHGISPHRYVWPSELDLMARLAGMELESRHADWTGTPFTSQSRSHVSVYRLP
jgi:enoyl-CoA hydratase